MSNKPNGGSEGNKPQTNQQQKPAPAPTPERNLRTGWVAVNDSADIVTQKGKRILKG
ncbi:UNVERIFIED_ORG: hypothetical protein M2355_001797 [Lelliottia amnigena]|nr:hypothetical protein [Lelliottia amnigena]